NAGTASAVFTVSLTTASAQPITASYATVDGSATAGGNAATGGSDYVATSGVLTFAPGVTAQQVTVAVRGDLVFETNEGFQVSLANPLNATLADAQGAGTIVNDDAPPTVAINDTTVTEGATGAALFTVTLTGATQLPATVDFVTTDGTATAGADYTTASGT